MPEFRINGYTLYVRVFDTISSITVSITLDPSSLEIVTRFRGRIEYSFYDNMNVRNVKLFATVEGIPTIKKLEEITPTLVAELKYEIMWRMVYGLRDHFD